MSVLLIANIYMGKNARGYTFGKKKPKARCSTQKHWFYCRLTVTVTDFITNRSGTNKSIVEFVISSDYLKLKIDVDISLLDNTTGYLTIDALDFFKLWYTHNHMSQKNSYITHHHM